MSVHNMNLNSPWYELVRNGTKIYEGIPITDEIKKICEGDTIVFHHQTDNSLPPVITKVKQVMLYPTFKSALETLPLQDIFPQSDMTIEKALEILSLETQNGVAMIEFRLKGMNPSYTKNVCDNIMMRYKWDREGAHVHEDIYVFDTIKDLVCNL